MVSWSILLELLSILVSTFMLGVLCFNDKNGNYSLENGATFLLQQKARCSIDVGVK